MKFLVPIFIFFHFMLAFHAETLGQESDTLYLRNGQVMVGTLKSIDHGIVEFDDKDLSLQNVRYHKIKTMKAVTRHFRIETIDKKLYIGVIKPTDDFNTIILDDGYLETKYKVVEIYHLVPLEKMFIRKIRGTISLGYSYTKSSEIGRLNTDTNLKFTENKYNISLVSSSAFTQDQESFTAEIANAQISGLYSLTSLWNTGVLLNYQRNIELGLNWRFQQGAAFGYHYLMRNNLQGNMLSGIVVNKEMDLEQNVSAALLEIPVIFTFDLFLFSQPNLQFTLNQNFYFGIDQDGRIRSDGNYRLDWEIVSNFKVGLQFYFNSDNKQLEGSTSAFDYGTVINIGYKLK